MDYDTIIAVVAALGVFGEALSLIPWVKSNGVCQFVFNLCKRVAGK